MDKLLQSPYFIYFAYGSNMLTQRLRDRTPSAKPLGIAQLTQHRLAFHKIGKDGSAKCDIQQTGLDRDLVYGVLFKIALEERYALDDAEGLGNGYEYKTVMVTSKKSAITAGAYYATHIDPKLEPFDWYLNLVIRGAEEHGLPDSYINSFKLRTAIADSDTERSHQSFLLLND